MSDLYNSVRDVFNESSYSNAYNRLLDSSMLFINTEDYYQVLLSEFILKKERIVPKESKVFDIDKNVDSVFDIVFLKNYIYKQWLERIEVLNNELNNFEPDSDTYVNITKKIESVERYIKDIETKFSQINVKLPNSLSKKERQEINKLYSNNLDDIKRGIVIIDKIRNSLAHKNAFFNSDKVVHINNYNYDFVASIPTKYIKGFIGDGINSLEDEDVMTETSRTVYPLLEYCGYDPIKLKSFFSKTNPKTLSLLLELCDNDINKLYSLDYSVFSLKSSQVRIFIKEFNDFELFKKFINSAFLFDETIDVLRKWKDELDVPDFDPKKSILINDPETFKYIASNYGIDEAKKIANYNGKRFPTNFYSKYNKKLFRDEIQIAFKNIKALIDMYGTNIVQYFDRNFFMDYRSVELIQQYVNEFGEDIIPYLNKKIVYFQPSDGFRIINKYGKKLFKYIPLEVIQNSEVEKMYDLMIENFGTDLIINNDLINESIADICNNFDAFYCLLDDFGADKILHSNLYLANLLKLEYKDIKDLISRYDLDALGGCRDFQVLKFCVDKEILRDLDKKQYFDAISSLNFSDISKLEYIFNEIGKEEFEKILLEYDKYSYISRYTVEDLFQILSNKNKYKELFKYSISKIALIPIRINKTITYGFDYNEFIELVEKHGIDKVFAIRKVLDVYTHFGVKNLYDSLLNNYSSEILSSLPYEVFMSSSKQNIDYLVKLVEPDYEKLKQFPIDFYRCDIDLLDTLISEYNYNFCKSIFGLDNPYVISFLVYSNSVLSKYNNFMDLDLSSLENNYFYANIVSMNPDLTNMDISEVIRHLRNSLCHFRFNYINDSIINLYDEHKGNTNFNINVEMSDVIEIVGILEQMIEQELSIQREDLDIPEEHKIR